jgi:hypothetical protein
MQRVAAFETLALRLPVWYKPAQRMSDHAHRSCSNAAGCGWSFYARFYAWRFS